MDSFQGRYSSRINDQESTSLGTIVGPWESLKRNPR